MNDRQFRWGLSGGISVLAIAGFFWYGVSIGVTTTRWGWWAWILSTTLQFGITTGFLWSAARIRRRSGFVPHDVFRGDEQQKKITRRILRIFGWIVLAQTLLVGAAVWLCVRTGTRDLMWPSIGLIVSIHFAPLGRLFHVRAYYATALIGAAISILGFTGISDSLRLDLFGGAMATVMWISALYVVRNVDRITDRGMREQWAA
jgi:hypothetical protein